MTCVKNLKKHESPYARGFAYCGGSRGKNHPEGVSGWIPMRDFEYAPDGQGPFCPVCGCRLRLSPRNKGGAVE